MTVFRKLRQLSYLSSYSHRGKYYTLAEIARFDQLGLWSHHGALFSRHGTLLNTCAVGHRQRLPRANVRSPEPALLHRPPSLGGRVVPDELRAAIVLFCSLSTNASAAVRRA